MYGIVCFFSPVLRSVQFLQRAKSDCCQFVCFDLNGVLWQILASTSYDDSIKLYMEDGDDWSCYATLGKIVYVT